jgi:hypothetical protein
MILPSKHLSHDRALLTVGAWILQHLSQPKTVSALWAELPHQGEPLQKGPLPLHYDVFVLTLDLLFLIGSLELHEGLLTRKSP